METTEADGSLWRGCQTVSDRLSSLSVVVRTSLG